MKVQCPNWPTPLDRGTEIQRRTASNDLVGCGHVFEAEADDEGIVDCPNCGIWFTPKVEPETIK